jgi:hypothetical protein
VVTHSIKYAIMDSICVIFMSILIYTHLGGLDLQNSSEFHCLKIINPSETQHIIDKRRIRIVHVKYKVFVDLIVLG